jgi:hypothetical protein
MMRAIHWRWMLFRVRIGSHESKPLPSPSENLCFYVLAPIQNVGNQIKLLSCCYSPLPDRVTCVYSCVSGKSTYIGGSAYQRVS